MGTYEQSFAHHFRSKNWSNRNTILPENVKLNSHKKFWFICFDCNHEFQTTCDKINSGHWCKYCVNQQLCNNETCKICFDKSFASHEKVLHWSSKNKLTARQVFKGSDQIIWFNCDCGHEFQSRCANIIKGQWCGYCGNNQLCDNNCKMCFDKSFASHEKALCWSSKNNLTTRQVFKSSNKKYWFNCPDCNHEFLSTCVHINAGRWCQYCANSKMCTCQICFDKSFASHEKALHWSSKNNLTARQVFKCSGQKFWFNCPDCNHEFLSTCASINNGSWCGYCANKLLCSDNNCKICFDKSFASHEKVLCWSSKNNLTARQVFKSSNKKYWFNCPDCKYEFQTTCNKIYFGGWCSICINKTELILLNKLKEHYSSVIHQFKAEWCKKQRNLPFDFLLPNHKIIIELDGAQHFRQVSNWQSPETTQEIDKFKIKCANDNGYSIIRLLQEDVFKNKFNWLIELTTAINKIATDNITQNIYICKNNEYEPYLLNLTVV